MSVEVKHIPVDNLLDRSRVMEQLRTSWGPLNKRISQDVLAEIGLETGLF